MKTFEIFTTTHSFTVQAGNPMAAIHKAINEKDFNIMNTIAIIECERGKEFIKGDRQLTIPVVSKAACDCELPNPSDPFDEFEKRICSKCGGFIPNISL